MLVNCDLGLPGDQTGGGFGGKSGKVSQNGGAPGGFWVVGFFGN